MSTFFSSAFHQLNRVNHFCQEPSDGIESVGMMAHMAEVGATLDVDSRMSHMSGFPSVSDEILDQDEIDRANLAAADYAWAQEAALVTMANDPGSQGVGVGVDQDFGSHEDEAGAATLSLSQELGNMVKEALEQEDTSEPEQGLDEDNTHEANQDIGVSSGNNASEKHDLGASTSSSVRVPESEKIPSRPVMKEPNPIASSLAEAFDFWDNCLDVLCAGKDEDECEALLEDLASQLERDTLSTAFSGICAPETAVKTLKFRLGERLGRKLRDFAGKQQHMIEWNTQSLEECKLIAAEDASCVFGDIGQFFRKELLESVIPELHKKPHTAIQTLKPLILSNRAVGTKGYCLVHNKYCCLKSCKRHMAGTSCKPFSRRGVQLGTNDGDMIYTLCWFAHRRILQEGDVTQENVLDFPLSLARELLEDLYIIEAVRIEPTMLGAPTARPRQFLRMRHRVKVLAEISPIAEFSKRFFRAVSFHWREQLG